MQEVWGSGLEGTILLQAQGDSSRHITFQTKSLAWSVTLDTHVIFPYSTNTTNFTFTKVCQTIFSLTLTSLILVERSYSKARVI
jgi:hypothetical protein